MIKRIVVGLDPSDYSKNSVELACLQVKKTNGKVIGVGTVDLPGIEKSSSGAGIGSSGFARRTRESLSKEASEIINSLFDDFEDKCSEFSVEYEMEKHTGAPVDRIIEASMSADLILIGLRTYYHFETQDKPGDTKQQLLGAQVCPIMAVSKDTSFPFDGAIIAYDNSAGAARAMRAMVSMDDDLIKTKNITLLHICDDEEKGQKLLLAPSKYLEAHGYNVKTRLVPGDARDVVLNSAKSSPYHLMVLGASNKGVLSRLFFGSVTKTLIDDGNIPLFISY